MPTSVSTRTPGPTIHPDPCTPGVARARVASSALRAGPVGAVGLELEAHLVDLERPATRVAWERVTAAVAALPPLPGASLVTLEPGGQVELSGPPQADVTAAVAALRADDAVLRASLRRDGLGLACLGADPARPPARVNPGHRYAAMEAYFGATGNGPAGAAMMTSTASLQVNLEAGPRAGWTQRVALAHAIGPVLVAVSACSPLLAGRETGWRSSRQLVWEDLDRARCGPLLGRAEPGQEWADYALAAPVMLVRDPLDDVASPVLTPTPFGAWAAGESPLGGRLPAARDLDYHLTTLFPPVRLRGFLELRYLDAAPARWWPALAAVTATLLDDPGATAIAWVATEPVAGAWTRAARLGLADPQLHRAAVRCLDAAVSFAPPGLRAEVEALAALTADARCPGDELLASSRALGPVGALAEEAGRG